MAAPKPFLCRVCGETDEGEFFFTKRNGKRAPYSKSLCKVHVREYNNDWHTKNNVENRKDQVLVRKYGVTSKEYQAQLEKQGGRCATCGITREEDIENRGRRWPVDHDHETDEVRGILCWLCNLALGAVKDRPDTLRTMAIYVESGGVW